MIRLMITSLFGTLCSRIPLKCWSGTLLHNCHIIVTVTLLSHYCHSRSSVLKLTDCDNANYLININNLYDNVFDSDSQTGDSPHYSFTNIIQNNTRILHSLKFSNSNLLLFLEALHIKFKKPELNSGLKASKELAVFP